MNSCTVASTPYTDPSPANPMEYFKRLTPSQSGFVFQSAWIASAPRLTRSFFPIEKRIFPKTKSFFDFRTIIEWHEFFVFSNSGFQTLKKVCFESFFLVFRFCTLKMCDYIVVLIFGYVVIVSVTIWVLRFRYLGFCGVVKCLTHL